MIPLRVDPSASSSYCFGIDLPVVTQKATPVERGMVIDIPSSSSLPVDYNLFERLFRVCVFQYAVYYSGIVEQLLVYLYRAISRATLYPPNFDAARVNRSLEVFKKMGAEEEFVIPDDGLAKIHMMTFTAEALEARIREKGGTWDKIGSVLAITPPDHPQEDWMVFQNECLLHKTGWKWALIDGKQRIVTCEHADLVTDQRLCSLHVHTPGGPFVREKERIGFWLGMKTGKSICLFDTRCFPHPDGVSKSEGIPSEKGYYLDAQIVLETVMRKQRLAPHQIWVSGTCGGGPIAAYLKSLYHAQGINFIAEQSFTNLEREMVENKCFLVRCFAYLGLSGLESRDIPPDVGPKEDHFDTENKWKHLPYSMKGKCVIIQADHDETLNEGAEERFFTLAKRVNQQVKKLTFSAPPDVNGHNELCLKDPKLLRPLTEMINEEV